MKIKTSAWISIAVCFVGLLVLANTIGNKLETNIPLYVMIVFEAIVMIVTLVSSRGEKKEKFCDVCHQQYDFEEDITYNVIRRYTKTHGYNPNNSSKQKIESLTYEVAFDCVCKKCNAKKSFVKKIDGGARYSDGTIDLKNPEESIEAYFKSEGLAINRNLGANIALGVIAIILSIILSFANCDSVKDIIGPSGNDKLNANNYYGTYYALSDDYCEYKLIITDRRVQLYEKSLMASGGISTYDNDRQVFYTAKYMAKLMSKNGKEVDFVDCGALVLDDRYVFWITKDNGSNSEFSILMESGKHVTFTSTKITVESKTGDPKNYYGTYYYGSNNWVVFKQNQCSLKIGSDIDGTCYYFYADAALMKNKFHITGVNKALVIYEGTSYIWFEISGNNLYLKGNTSQKFEKE